ncbi:hypothetical protein [Priestia megaterium]|uniref:hypothetical protein n=1 Tax=Priestia megaterium TaxID=1404 RepID=UPI0028773CD8|nr:hypothetical protein [Priestia megaterium]MBX4164449.1 hypothetical protein [Priestia megaterium]
MKFIIEKRYAILKVEEKVKVDLYHLIDLDSGDKVTAVGVKADGALNNLDVVDVKLSLTLKTERVETKKDGVKFLQVTNIFVSEIQKVTA